jgi:hypothetical protein
MKKLFTLLIASSAFVAFSQNRDNLIIDGESCGIHGSSKEGSMEYTQNVQKNRYNFPTAKDFNTNLELKNFVDGSAVKGKYLNDDKPVAVEITGYVFEVKPGGKETCNCKTDDPLFRDTHIEITLSDKKTGPEQRFIVEVTPRIRQIMADKGINWTTEGLKAKMKGHMVKIQGWLFFDGSHVQENFADDPNDEIGRANWRATCYEIHPITSIEILDENDVIAESFSNEGPVPPIIINPKPNNPTNPSTPKTSDKMQTTPLNTLIIIILGAILGMVGQGMRVIVGIKKVGDDATNSGQEQKDLIKTGQIVLSLFLAFAIGAVAGVLAAVGSEEIEFTKSTVIAFIAAGYAGTDFIEGFIKKTPAATNTKGTK